MEDYQSQYVHLHRKNGEIIGITKDKSITSHIVTEKEYWILSWRQIYI